MLDSYTLAMNALDERDNANENAKIDYYEHSVIFEPFELFLEDGESVWVESEEQMDSILDTIY